MFQTIFLLVLTISTTLVRARLIDQDAIETEMDEGLPNDFGSLVTLDSALDEDEDSGTQSEEADAAINRLTLKMNELDAKVKALEAMTSHALNETVNCKGTVAFHAVNPNGIISHLGVNQKIQFGTVLLNIGNGYNHHHSIFTAPVAGVYMFSSSMLSANGAHNALFAADIIINNVLYARLYGKGLHGYHAQGSNTIVANLRRGDTAAVRLACCANSGMYGGYYSSFTGVLLRG